jgi:hypothetical protein
MKKRVAGRSGNGGDRRADDYLDAFAYAAVFSDEASAASPLLRH